MDFHMLIANYTGSICNNFCSTELLYEGCVDSSVFFVD